jgi:putative iron-regulated protein
VNAQVLPGRANHLLPRATQSKGHRGFRMGAGGCSCSPSIRGQITHKIPESSGNRAAHGAAIENTVDYHYQQYRVLRMPLIARTVVVSALIFGSIAACASGSTPSDGPPFPTEIAKQAIENYKRNAYREYSACLVAAEQLDAAVAAFVANPTEATHKSAKDAWIAARVLYGPSEAHRLYNGPIDNDKTGPESRVDGWPLDESYIDYTRESATSGLVNDGSKPITTQLLIDQNEKGGDDAITTGWHAIEFLLWGQDDIKSGTGAGKRPYTDFKDGGTASNQGRRREYLVAATRLLVEDLRGVKQAWDPAKANGFANQFGVEALNPTTTKDPTTDAVGSLLKAVGSMAKAELSGERMTVAFKNRSQEDEQSCFSDTSATDMLGNGLGLQNLWLGRYGTNDGIGLDDVVKTVNPLLASKTTKDLAEAVTQLQALETLQDQGTPIDVIIESADDMPGRVAMLRAIKSLKLVGDDIEEVIKTLGLKVQLGKPTVIL